MINLEILKQAIQEYREEGKRLMFELGKKFNLDITKQEDYRTLISKANTSSIPRSGELSKWWNYGFHGAECGFYNMKYQQTIEVVLSNPPEFGHLNAWFLMGFLETTEKYKSLVKGLSYTDLKPGLEKLYARKEIEYVATY